MEIKGSLDLHKLSLSFSTKLTCVFVHLDEFYFLRFAQKCDCKFVQLDWEIMEMGCP